MINKKLIFITVIFFFATVSYSQKIERSIEGIFINNDSLEIKISNYDGNTFKFIYIKYKQTLVYKKVESKKFLYEKNRMKFYLEFLNNNEFETYRGKKRRTIWKRKK